MQNMDRNALVLEYLPLGLRVAQRMRAMPSAELRSEVCYALVTASRLYDEQYVSQHTGEPVKFSTFAFRVVRRHIADWLTKQNRVRHLAETFGARSSGRSPASTADSDAASPETERAKELQFDGGFTARPRAVGIEVENWEGDCPELAADEHCSRRKDAERIREALQLLTPRERSVADFMLSDEGWTDEEIGRELRIGERTVRRDRVRIRQKLAAVRAELAKELA